MSNDIYATDKAISNFLNIEFTKCVTDDELTCNNIISQFIPWNKGKFLTKEHKDKIKDSVRGSKNGFYGKKHNKKSMNQMVNTRLKSGNGDYYHGKNPFGGKESHKKAINNREKNGNNYMSIPIILFGIKYKSISEASRFYNIKYKRLYNAYLKAGVKEMEQIIGVKSCPPHIC